MLALVIGGAIGFTVTMLVAHVSQVAHPGMATRFEDHKESAQQQFRHVEDKIDGLKEDVKEVKTDVKVLLRRNGGEVH